MKSFYPIILLLSSFAATAQKADTTSPLEMITVKAYEQERLLKDAPAAINFINKQTLDRFSSASIVQAVNTTPGVRLEERSPGSYRFNIRGSSLRSPFGVRNVKVYYNSIPYTDPGGQTYFNSLGYYNFHSLEVVKGPGSSLYGAGTGGVLLIESMDAHEQPNIVSEYTAGSYGLHNIYAGATVGNETAKNKIGFQHQQSDGYRNQSALERNILSWNGRYRTSENASLKTTFLYSNLFYETPGALTKAEYDLNPKMARPPSGAFPGAEQAQASIHQKTFLAGMNYSHQFTEAFANNTSAYGMYTELRNPAIRNFGKNEEPHVGGRTSFSYKNNLWNGTLNLSAGGELQQGFASVFVYKNKNGQPDTLQSLDELRIRQSLVFLQAAYASKGWELTAGASLNYLQLSFKRSAPLPLPQQQRNFENKLAPRISIARKWNAVTVYASVAEGFSPPTSAELLPSGSAVNLALNAEEGINYDLGFRGTVKRFSFDVNAFWFALQNTIVQRRDAGGGDYFVNAGETSQKGIESTISYSMPALAGFVKQSRFWFSHTYHHFRYKDFKQVNTDFSGNQLPGTAPHTISTGMEMMASHGISANLNYYYSDKIALNDANSEYAAQYHLLNLKIGFEKYIGNKWKLQLNAGAENLLGQKYSLGNDINGAGGRYYNAAPQRSYFASIAVQVFQKGKKE